MFALHTVNSHECRGLHSTNQCIIACYSLARMPWTYSNNHGQDCMDSEFIIIVVTSTELEDWISSHSTLWSSHCEVIQHQVSIIWLSRSKFYYNYTNHVITANCSLKGIPWAYIQHFVAAHCGLEEMLWAYTNMHVWSCIYFYFLVVIFVLVEYYIVRNWLKCFLVWKIVFYLHMVQTCGMAMREDKAWCYDVLIHAVCPYNDNLIIKIMTTKFWLVHIFRPYNIDYLFQVTLHLKID